MQSAEGRVQSYSCAMRDERRVSRVERREVTSSAECRVQSYSCAMRDERRVSRVERRESRRCIIHYIWRVNLSSRRGLIEKDVQ